MKHNGTTNENCLVIVCWGRTSPTYLQLVIEDYVDDDDFQKCKIEIVII